MELRDRYRHVVDSLAAAAERSGRTADDVMMVAVTKNATPDQIRTIVEMGHRDLGENRVQHLAQRVSGLNEFLMRKRTLAGAVPRSASDTPDSVRWHMIGQLQRNKVKQVVPLVDLIHSVDSLRLAEELHNYGNRTDQVIDILIQVNASGETNKGGIAPPAVIHLADQIDTMLHLRLRGLMTMAPLTDDPEKTRPVFARVRELYEDLKSHDELGPNVTVLSMGMTNDYQVAVEEGANVVRIGRALFGDVEA